MSVMNNTYKKYSIEEKNIPNNSIVENDDKIIKNIMSI